MQSYMWMLQQAGQNDQAAAFAPTIRSLREAIHRNFWDAKVGALATYIEGGSRKHFCDLANMLAIKTNTIPPDNQEGVLDRIYSRTLVPMALGPLLYQWLALMDRDARARQFCADSLARNFEPMVLRGATTLWETQVGSPDFDNAGSLCHGWSALPVYHYHAHVLGVRPLEPGFRKFLIRPFPDRLFWAAGAVQTPAGAIRVAWQKTDRGLAVQADGPADLEPVVQALEEAPVIEARYNNRPLI
jgi:hypothetical protein